MTTHKIGDMVRVDCHDSIMHGITCVVIGEIERYYDNVDCVWFYGHEVSLPLKDEDGWCGFEPHELIPISRLTVDELADAEEAPNLANDHSPMAEVLKNGLRQLEKYTRGA